MGELLGGIGEAVGQAASGVADAAGKAVGSVADAAGGATGDVSGGGKGATSITANYTPAGADVGESGIGDKIAEGLRATGDYLAKVGSATGDLMAETGSKFLASQGVAPSADGEYHTSDVAQGVGKNILSHVMRGGGKSNKQPDAANASSQAPATGNSGGAQDGNAQAQPGTSRVPAAMQQQTAMNTTPTMPTQLLSFQDAFNNNLSRGA